VLQKGEYSRDAPVNIIYLLSFQKKLRTKNEIKQRKIAVYMNVAQHSPLRALETFEKDYLKELAKIFWGDINVQHCKCEMFV